MGAFGAVGFALYAWLVASIRNGKPVQAAAAAYCSGPIPILLVGTLVEDRNLGEMLRTGLKVWALSLGDYVALPLAAALLALAFKHMPKTRQVYGVDSLGPIEVPMWYRRPLWWWGTLVFGFCAGLAFHLTDKIHYPVLAANSPGKLTHDFIVYVILAGGLLHGLIPALLKRVSRKLALCALGLLIAWAIMVAIDSTINIPSPGMLHRQYDWEHLKVVPYWIHLLATQFL